MNILGLLVVVLLANEQAGARVGPARCEALLQEAAATPVLKHLEAAACFDDEWQFARVKEQLTEAVKLLQAEAAGAQDTALPGGARVFAGASVPIPPRTNTPLAEYSSELALKGVTGTVVTELVVDRDGRVRTVRVVESVPQLDRSATDFVRQFRFETARVNNVPTEIAMFMPVRYGLPSALTTADRARLAAIYYRERRVAVASQTAAIALNHANRDVARYGGDTNIQDLQRLAAGSSVLPEGVTEPTRVKFAEPVYPEYAVRARLEGRVTLIALVDVNGAVGRARVTNGIHGLNASALDSVLQWQYTPTTVGGEKRAVPLIVFVNYAIKR